MHRGRPFEIEQQLRAFAANNLYSFGWAAKAYSISLGTYTGSSAVFVTNPTPDIVFTGFDPDFLGGEYRGPLNGPPFTPLEVGFHFRFDPIGQQAEMWIQTWFNGNRCLNEPKPGTNYQSYAWAGYSAFIGNPGGPFSGAIRPTRIIYLPKTY